MGSVTFYNKRKLCYTDIIDFTDYQGVGSDPLYKRFSSVSSVVKNKIDDEFQSFFATPYYEDGIIEWYVDKWTDIPVSYTELTELELQKYAQIKEKTITHYSEALAKLNNRSEEFIILSGALKHINDDFIYCFDNKVVLIAWGMCPDTSQHNSIGSWIKGLDLTEKIRVTFDVNGKGKFTNPLSNTLNRAKGYILREDDIPKVIADNGYIFTGWSPEPKNLAIKEDTRFTAQFIPDKTQQDITCDSNQLEVRVTFDAGNQGNTSDKNTLICRKGHILTDEEIPLVTPNVEYEFSHWEPDIKKALCDDTTFIANYKSKQVTCYFDTGEYGSTNDPDKITKPYGSHLTDSEIPILEVKRGYDFIGWDKPLYNSLTNDITFTAEYELKQAWYKRLWPWSRNNSNTGSPNDSSGRATLWGNSGCLRWVAYTLLTVFLLWMILFLLRTCEDTKSKFTSDNNPGVTPVEKVLRDDSEVSEESISIVNPDQIDISSDYNIVAPIVGDKGKQPVIIHHDGAPSIIANRLNIYFSDSNASLEQWIRDFKQAYPDSDYTVIGYDLDVRMIQIQIPEHKRDQVRTEITGKIPNQEFFVVDESIIDLRSVPINHNSNTALKGWHLAATHVEKAWEITTGKPEVVIAIVDDGIDSEHELLQGRIYKPYNVFTRSQTLAVGEGHGTHVAGIAAGNKNYLEKKAAGIAPSCQIMPIQVFDNNICTFSSLASGIMYAIHNGADVVNISIGPSFNGLDQLPLEEQAKIAKTYFVNEERVYQHIINTANEKNVILVFAAGNDNIMTAVLPECRAYNKTINVAAVTQELKASSFTNYAEGTNTAAPGVAINSAYPANSYKVLDGTSMAAPIITGTVALMRSINPKITVSQALLILKETGILTDQYLPPMVQVDKAIQAVQSGKIPKDVNSPNRELPEAKVKDRATDYDLLNKLLNELKRERDTINKKIKEIENKINQ